ncbi:hypothetical protein HPB47_001739, partial [Ixodes persulcatus]
CRVLRSEWWHQVRFFKDCLRVACTNAMHPRDVRLYQEWTKISVQTTEFLWHTVRLTLPSKKKAPSKEGKILILGEQSVPEVHQDLLKKGPKFCFEPGLDRVDKLVLSR